MTQISFRPMADKQTLTDNSIPDFIDSVFETLKENTCGYAVWAYRDIINDHLFNSSFQRGTIGYDLKGDAWLKGACELHMGPGGSLHHKIGYVRMEPSGTTVTFRICGTGLTAGALTIEIFGDAFQIDIPEGPFSVDVSRPAGPASRWELSVNSLSSCCVISRIALFNIVISNKLYSVDWNKGPGCEALLQLNERLSKL